MLDTHPLLPDLVARLRTVPGVRAIVLGGSRARGTHTAASDIDLGLYYAAAQPLDVAALDRVAAALDDSHQPGLVTPIGGWGPWINGGGWLHVRGQAVDCLYRDLDQVTAVMERCLAGHIEMVYQPGHPHGFVSAIYLAETALCRPLWEAAGEVTALQARTRPYPARLQAALIEKFAWEIGFALLTARKGQARGDVAYVAGCAFRAVACLLQVLFALNEQYWLNEKGALALAEGFALRPPDLQARVEAAIAALAPAREAMEPALAGLEVLAAEVEALVETHARAHAG